MGRNFICIAFSALIIIIFFIFSFTLISSYNNTNYEEEDFGYFYISHFNPISSKANFGFVKSRLKYLGEKEYIISSSSNKNDLFSVDSSKFSNEEFECYGTCLCNDQNDQNQFIQFRRNINILSKSLYFVISAFSLSLAIRIATDYFSEECFNSLKDSCFEESINSEINFCSKKQLSGKSQIFGVTTEENYILKDKDDDGIEREFHCKGYCTQNGNLRRIESIVESEKFECEKYTTEVRVVVYETGKLGFLADETIKAFNKARIRFKNEYLVPYCRSISKYKYDYVYDYPDGDRSIIRERKVNLCVASSPVNDNIRCHLLDRFSPADGVRERERIRESLEKFTHQK